MHFLLVPFLLLGITFVAQYQGRRAADARTGLVLTAGLTLFMLFLAMTVRPIAGDSWRYYQYFLELQTMSLQDAVVYKDPDPLYAILNWLVVRLGTEAWLLYGVCMTLYMTTFVLALRRLGSGPIAVSVLIMCYAAYPYFIAYGASGIRQGLSLVFLLMGYLSLREGRRPAWVWLLIAPFWHSGAWLGVAVALAHQLMCRVVSRPRLRWILVLGSLAITVGLSVTGLNETVMAQLPEFIALHDRYDIYLSDPIEIDYRTGFRPDFFVFSLLPLISAWLLRRYGDAFDYAGSGWWLSLYLSLNGLYHLFAFAPFADRFAAFSWFLMPLVIFLQIRATHRRAWMSLLVSGATLINVLMLQFYTGKWIRTPEWWI